MMDDYEGLEDMEFYALGVMDGLVFGLADNGFRGNELYMRGADVGDGRFRKWVITVAKRLSKNPAFNPASDYLFS